MPVNKNALLRYQILDRCLSDHRRFWTWKDLLEVINQKLEEDGLIGIGKTTLFEDLKALEYGIYEAEIERIKDGRTQYLRYKDPNFSINSRPLNETEADQLKAALQVLARFQGNPQFDWVHEIIPEISSKLGFITNDKPVISFDSNLDYEGLSFITPIFNAIIHSRVMEITYQDFKSALAYEVTLHPYYLKQFNHRWYVFGYNELRQRIENLALDRIKELKETGSTSLANDTDWEDYFAEFIGVSKGEGEAVEVRILINDAQQAAYIRTNPLHQTQKPIRESQNGFETSITVIPNFELEKLILSFGERIKVLSPESLISRIANRIESLNKLYHR